MDVLDATQRGAAEMTKIMNRSAPTATVVPVLIYEDPGKAADWLCNAFGFRERLRVPGRGDASRTINHAQLDVAEGSIMLGRQGLHYHVPTADIVTQYVLVHVDDVDAHFLRAKQAAVRIVRPPANMPFGERSYSAVDFAGHQWTFSQHIADVAPHEWGAVTKSS